MLCKEYRGYNSVLSFSPLKLVLLTKLICEIHYNLAKLGDGLDESPAVMVGDGTTR